MSNVFLTSDFHFNHSREFIYKARGYDSVEEMNQDIIRIYNNCVQSDDICYVLGDLCLGGSDLLQANKELIEQLNGKLIIVTGNHCTNQRIEMYKTCKNVQEVINWATVIKYKKYHIYLSHYPAKCSNYDDGVSLHKKVLSFCGHSHTTDRFADWDSMGVYHVEWDAHSRPVELDAAIKEVRQKVDSFYESVDLGLNYTDNCITPIITINPAAPVMSCVARCNKCVYSWPMCGDNDSLGSCPNYKRDLPDGELLL